MIPVTIVFDNEWWSIYDSNHNLIDGATSYNEVMELCENNDYEIISIDSSNLD